LVTRIPSRVSSTKGHYREYPLFCPKSLGFIRSDITMIFMYYFVFILIWKNSKNPSPGRPVNRVHVHDILYYDTVYAIAAFDYGNKFGTISFLTELKAPHREHREMRLVNKYDYSV